MGRINTTNAKEAGLKTVGSSAGFLAGDLIYQTASDTGTIPASYAGGTGTFNKKGTKPVAKKTDTTYYSKTLVPLNAGHFVNGTPAATLSNGNVVTIYARAQNQTGPYWQNSDTYQDIYFRIDQPDGTNVVAETIINETTTAGRLSFGYTVACVAASSGGGFAVCWNNYNSSQKMLFQGFNNDGTTNGSITDLPYRTYNFVMAASPSGKYLVGSFDVDGSSLARYTKLDSDGTNLVTATAQANSYPEMTHMDIACDESNVFHFIHVNTSAQCKRLRIDDTGTLLNTFTVFSGSAAYFTPRIQIKSDNLAIISVIKDLGSTFELQAKIETSANTFSDVTLLEINEESDLDYCSAAIGKIGTDQFYCTHSTYAKTVATAFDSSGSLLGGVNFGSGVGATAGGARAVILVGSEARVYIAAGQYMDNSGLEVKSRGLASYGYYKLDSDYMESGGNESSEITVASATGGIDLYDRANSSVSKAAFLSSSTLSELVTAVKTTDNNSLVQPQTSIASAEVRLKVRGHELDDGKIAIAYTQGNTNLQVIILNADYTVDRSFSFVARTGTQNYPFDFERLNDGSFVIGYIQNGTSNYVARKYSSDMQEIIGETLLQTAVQSEYTANLCAIKSTDGEFAFGYVNTNSYPSYAIFRGDLTRKTGNNLTTTNANGAQIIEIGDGTLAAFYNQGGSGQFYGYYLVSSLNNGVYSAAAIGGGLNTTYLRRNHKPFKSAGGESYFHGQSSGNSYSVAMYGAHSTQNNTTEAFSSSAYTNDWGPLMGVTGNGIPIVFNQMPSYSDGNRLWTQRYSDGEFGTISISNLGLSLKTGSNQEGSGFIIPSAGPTCHIVVNDSLDNLTICKVRVEDEYTPISLTAGVSSSEPIDVISSTAAFIGVSSTDCAAGETALVQAKGAAVLSDSYPADTAQTNFDFRQPTTEGVAGSINGRNVTLGE